MNEIMERPKFLIDLLAEVDAFDAELFPANTPFSAEDGDQVIGELSPWCRKLYALVRYLNRQSKVMAAEREFDSVEMLSQDSEICEMRYKANLLNELMYAILRSECNAFGTSCVGVRQGWNVVSTTPDDDVSSFEEFLRSVVKRKKKG